MDLVKYWMVSSILFGVFNLVLRLILLYNFTKRLHFVKLFVRHTLLGHEEGRISKEIKTGVVKTWV